MKCVPGFNTKDALRESTGEYCFEPKLEIHWLFFFSRFKFGFHEAILFVI